MFGVDEVISFIYADLLWMVSTQWHSNLLTFIVSPSMIHLRACCSFAYLLFGLLCFDRFTSRAFLSTQDPVASTAIPSGGDRNSKYEKYDAPNLP